MRLIDADKLQRPIHAADDNITGSGMTYDEMDSYNCGVDCAWSKINAAATVDAVPVVRCEDCIHSYDRSMNEDFLCCSELDKIVHKNFYCEYGMNPMLNTTKEGEE